MLSVAGQTSCQVSRRGELRGPMLHNRAAEMPELVRAGASCASDGHHYLRGHATSTAIA